MNQRRLSIGLPLLTKELVEQSARKRTYIVRVFYATLLFTASYFAFYDILGSSQADLFGVLGNGRRIFEFIVAVQFFGIYLFMPAISCGVLTAEKERNSLGLLFLTRLGPSAILFEKLFSRLVPMLSFLLLSLPLLAFAYSLGGITTNYLICGVWVLALTMLQMAALGVMCSAFFRRTVGSFLGAYLIGLAVLFTLPVASEFGLIDLSPPTLRFGSTVQLDAPLHRFLQWLGIIGHGHQDIPFALFGPYIFDEHGSDDLGFGMMVMRSLPMILSCVLFLVLARVFVVRRAFTPARHLLLGLFRMIDGLFTRMNQNRVTRGIVLIREKSALPDDQPVAWRETTKKSLGTARYLIRILVAAELPVIAVCIIIGFAGSAADLTAISAVLFLLWFVAVLLISVKATSLVSGERSHETLDVLLTTPLSARDIVLQKFRGVRRLMYVLAVPFVTIFLFEASWRGIASGGGYYNSYGYYRQFSTLLYLTSSLLSMVIYLPMIAWLSFLVGMLLRTQGRAIIASLGIIVGWCIGPLLFLMFLDEVLIRGISQAHGAKFLLTLSPATIVPLVEFNDAYSMGESPWAFVIVNFVMYGGFLFLFRFACMRMANKFLGRADG